MTPPPGNAEPQLGAEHPHASRLLFANGQIQREVIGTPKERRNLSAVVHEAANE